MIGTGAEWLSRLLIKELCGPSSLRSMQTNLLFPIESHAPLPWIEADPLVSFPPQEQFQRDAEKAMPTKDIQLHTRTYLQVDAAPATNDHERLQDF